MLFNHQSDGLSQLAFEFFLVWFVFELMFFGIVSLAIHQSLQKLKRPPAYDIPPVTLIRRIFYDVERISTYTPVKFLEGFFCGADINSIRVGNMQSFLAWVMYAEEYHNLNHTQTIDLNNMIQEISTKYSIHFPAGHNYDIRHVKMTLEPLLFVHRPLSMYLFFGLNNLISDMTMSFAGFRRGELSKMKYWYRPARPNCTNPVAMAYFHGITTGWSGALALINLMSVDREVILFDLDCIKINSLNFNMPTAELFAARCRSILDFHNIKKVSIVGHSFGTITAGWFARNNVDIVTHITLIDPVSLLLHFPDVAVNFLYRKPRKIMEWLIHLFASREITISNSLRRNFWWYKNSLWIEDLPAHIGILVSLAGGDEVTSSPSVEEYVRICHEERQAKVTDIYATNKPAPCTSIYFDGYSHAEILFRTNSIQQLATTFHQQEKKMIIQ